MNFADAVKTLERFSGDDLTQTLSRIELSVEGRTSETCAPALLEHHAHPEALAAAGHIKRLAGQINVLVHALGMLLCLPELLAPDEVIERISLGAGNTGKPFDLETDRRIAEFKFIAWQGGPESIRQNSLFKDFYGLAESHTTKSKHLYVLGTKSPLKFLNGGRALSSVLSKNVKLHEEFKLRYPEYRVVREYFQPRRGHVRIEDVAPILPSLAGEFQGG